MLYVVKLVAPLDFFFFLRKMLGPQLSLQHLSQLAHVASREWWSCGLTWTHHFFYHSPLTKILLEISLLFVKALWCSVIILDGIFLSLLAKTEKMRNAKCILKENLFSRNQKNAQYFQKIAKCISVYKICVMNFQ